MNKKTILTILIFLSLFLTSCAKNNEKNLANVQETQTEKKVEEKPKLMALDFSLKMTDNKDFRLLENKDKSVFVNYWATWCPPCVREFPDLEEMYLNYKDKMIFIAVNSAESKATIEAFMNKNKFTIPVAMDSDNRVGMMYGIQSIPTSFIVNTEGEIVFAQMGMMTKNQMKQAIEKALEN